MRARVGAAGLALLLAGGPTLVGAQEEGPALPGGASSLQETYHDWRVACTAAGGTKRCGLSQQHSQQDGRRVLAIEFIPADANGLAGTLVLPFGLRLDAGVILTVDDRPVGEGFRFSTCLPAGCVVPLALDAAAVEALRSGETLKLAATANDSGAPLTFSVSLRGFTAGIQRTAELLR